MDEHLPFLRAICADPADDLPRLVFADFLEETGDPDQIARAHFIRAQIALTQLHVGSAEFRDTEALQDRLFEMYRDNWVWDLPDVLHRGALPIWRRGFIVFVRMPWDDFVDDERLFETVPLTRMQITEMRTRRGTTTESWDALPYVRRLTHLKLGPNMNRIGLAVFLGDSDEQGTLSSLLLEARSFAALTHLDLGDNTVDRTALAEFILHFEEAAFAPTLKELDLSDIRGLDDAVGNALATARGFESLERLILKRTELSEPVRAMLCRRFGERVVF